MLTWETTSIISSGASCIWLRYFVDIDSIALIHRSRACNYSLKVYYQIHQDIPNVEKCNKNWTKNFYKINFYLLRFGIKCSFNDSRPLEASNHEHIWTGLVIAHRLSIFDHEIVQRFWEALFRLRFISQECTIVEEYKISKDKIIIFTFGFFSKKRQIW